MSSADFNKPNYFVYHLIREQNKINKKNPHNLLIVVQPNKLRFLISSLPGVKICHQGNLDNLLTYILLWRYRRKENIW